MDAQSRVETARTEQSSTPSLDLSQVGTFLKGFGSSGAENLQPIGSLVLRTEAEELSLLTGLRTDLLEQCGEGLPSDDFLLLCLRVWRYKELDALRVAKKFVSFRRGAGWPFQLSAESVCPALSTGMHWLLPNRDSKGRRVLVYNVRFLDTRLCSVENYQKMGCYVLEQAMLEIETADFGVTLVIDLQGVNPFTLLPSFGLSDLTRGTDMWRDAYPCKLKQIFVINLSAALRFALSGIIRVLPQKIQERVIFVSTNLAELHTVVPASVLPPSLGGVCDPSWKEWCAERQGATSSTPSSTCTTQPPTSTTAFI